MVPKATMCGPCGKRSSWLWRTLGTTHHNNLISFNSTFWETPDSLFLGFERIVLLSGNFFEGSSVYIGNATRGVGGYHHRATDRQLPTPLISLANANLLIFKLLT